MGILLITIIALALIFDYINGFHDAANSIATVVSTKVLTPFQAVLWAAFFNAVAYFIFSDHAVANTVGKTVVKEFITLPVILSGLIAAIFWNLLTWWWGIPSSSSHTLIGGFAGAAICAALMKDGSLQIMQIIDGGKVKDTIMFIVLAPLIGMLISMFYTLVLIHPNTWLKCAILAATGVVIWLAFVKFQDGKVQKNISSFYRIDKNSKIVSSETLKLGKEQDPAKKAAIQGKIDEAQTKVDKANLALESSIKYTTQFESKGGKWVAEQILADRSIDIKTTINSRFGDKLNKFFKTEQLKAKSAKDAALVPAYEHAKNAVDSLKPLAKLFHTLGKDSMVAAMIASVDVGDPAEQVAFSKAMAMDVQKDLAGAVEKASNRTLRYFLIGGLIIFILSFIYTEKIREPSAGRTSSLFKRLQLLSSAGFSIGHGGNDAQKVMGIVGAALVANGQYFDIDTAIQAETWIPLACYAAIGLGTLSGGWKIVKTMGTKITKVTPIEGVAAETAGATTLFLTEQMGIPVSTTHTITGAIIGVGATKRLSAVRWGVTINLLWAWILTIPVSAIVAALTYMVVSNFIK